MIGQYVETSVTRASTRSMSARSGGFEGSALFAYKLNWQTVLFLGYGDSSVLQDWGDLAHSSRQFFLGKISYAFQR